jgi:hypothetical protein
LKIGCRLALFFVIDHWSRNCSISALPIVFVNRHFRRRIKETGMIRE